MKGFIIVLLKNEFIKFKTKFNLKNRSSNDRETREWTKF